MANSKKNMNAQWRIRDGRLISFPPFRLAGIINLTPDSFSDGQGPAFNPQDTRAALARATRLLAEGADILDLGGESTRPGATLVSVEEEKRRVLPALAALLEADFSVPEPVILSLDTRNAACAAAALELNCRSHAQAAPSAAGTPGADASGGHLIQAAPRPDTPRQTAHCQAPRRLDVINDISGALFDPAMPEVLAHYKPGYILGHCPASPAIMQQAPRYANVVEDLYAYFTDRLNSLVKAGLPEECVAIDPCIGFGKSLQHNQLLLKNIERFHQLGRPLFLGISRKAFIKEVLGCATGPAAGQATEPAASPATESAAGLAADIPADRRDQPTAVLSALLAARGVQMHRVHAVAPSRTALKLAEFMA